MSKPDSSLWRRLFPSYNQNSTNPFSQKTKTFQEDKKENMIDTNKDTESKSEFKDLEINEESNDKAMDSNPIAKKNVQTLSRKETSSTTIDERPLSSQNLNAELKDPPNTLPNLNDVDTFDEDDDENDNENQYGLEAGDHIYSWRAMGAYSHHGIVLSVSKVSVVIVDFYPSKSNSYQSPHLSNHDESFVNSETTALNQNDKHYGKDNYKKENNENSTKEISTHSSTKQEERLRIINLSEWKKLYGRPRKVQYNAPYLQRSLYRSGTCCSMESHPSFLVLARARFLLLSPDHDPQNDSTTKNKTDIQTNTKDNQQESTNTCYIPHYHPLHANSETLSVWCKTGHFSTLQVADFLHLTWAGQLKSSITLSAFLSTQTVQIPAAGVWGYMGFTTKVGLLATQPMLLPALVGYGILTVGTPLYMLRQCHVYWNEREEDLNGWFWSGGRKKGDVLLNDLVLECVEYWYVNPKREKEKEELGKEKNNISESS